MRSEVENRVILKDGESLKSKGSRTKGFMGETDIYSYDVLDSENQIVGSVEYSHHTAVKEFKVTQTLVQKDLEGNAVVDDRW
jgi:hypothetical protein